MTRVISLAVVTMLLSSTLSFAAAVPGRTPSTKSKHRLLKGLAKGAAVLGGGALTLWGAKSGWQLDAWNMPAMAVGTNLALTGFSPSARFAKNFLAGLGVTLGAGYLALAGDAFALNHAAAPAHPLAFLAEPLELAMHLATVGLIGGHAVVRHAQLGEALKAAP